MVSFLCGVHSRLHAMHALLRSSSLSLLMTWHPSLSRFTSPLPVSASEYLLYLHVPPYLLPVPLRIFLTFSGLSSCKLHFLLPSDTRLPCACLHPSGYPPGGRGMHGLLAGEACLLRVQRLTVPPPQPKDFQHRMCSQPFPNVELASLYKSYLGPVTMQARLGACLRQALHGQDWALWKQWRPALLSRNRNDSTVSRRRGHPCGMRHLLRFFRILWPLSAHPRAPATSLPDGSVETHTLNSQ